MAILGTTDVVADMAILGTNDVVADMNTLATADIVSDMNTLAVADVISDMNDLATSGNITAMSTCSTNIASIQNASSNISSVNNFGDTYQVAANNPSTDGGGNALAEGDLYFNTSANRLKVYDGANWVNGVEISSSGAVTTGNTFTGDNKYNDNVKALFGTGSDLEIFHDGGNSRIVDVGNGKLMIDSNGAGTDIRKNASENMAKFITDGAAELYYDNSKKFETTTNGATISGSIVVNGNVNATGDLNPNGNITIANTSPQLFLTDTNHADFSILVNNDSFKVVDETNSANRLKIDSTGNVQIPADSKKLQIGDSQDLNLYHNGAHTYIRNTTGVLHLDNYDGDIKIRPKDSEDGIKVITDGAVELYHNNEKKFETTSTGATVSGNNFIIQDTGDVTLTLFADTDNSDETHCPTIDFTMDGGVNVMKIGVEGNGGDTFTGSSANRPYIITTTGHGGQPLDFGTSNAVRMTLADTGLLPAANNTYDLGTTGYKWRDIYVNNFQTTSTGFAASGTEFKFSDAGDCNVIINADTDNDTSELHHPSLSFKQDGIVHVLDIGINSLSSDFTGGSHNFGYIKVGGHANVGLEIATSGSAGNNPTKRLTIDHDGHILPGADSTYNIGTNANRFANAYVDTYYGDGSNLTGINTDLVADTSPQLGGNLASNGNNINMADNDEIVVGSSNDLIIRHIPNSRHEILGAASASLQVRCDESRFLSENGNEDLFRAVKDGAFKAYFDSSKKLETDSTGVKVTGTIIKLNDDSAITGTPHIFNYTRGTGATSGLSLYGAESALELVSTDDGTHGSSLLIRTAVDGAGFVYNPTTNALELKTFSTSQDNFNIHNNGAHTDQDLQFRVVKDSKVELYYNGSKKFETTSQGVEVTSSGDARARVTCSGHANLDLQTTSGSDHCSLNFGDSDDINAGMIQYTHSSNIMQFHTNGAERFRVDASGHVLPTTNNDYDLGSTSKRWRNIYTNDLNLSNEGGANDVDGTWGDWTIQEGESDLFLKNNRSGKKYKFNLMEVS